MLACNAIEQIYISLPLFGNECWAMVTADGCHYQTTADPCGHTAHGCRVLHWDVLSLYVLRLPYKPQSWYFWQAVCITLFIVSFQTFI